MNLINDLKELVKKNKTLLIIVGPTASGKTQVALELARILDGEIISSDSMQVYKQMNIGTDKVPLKIRKELPHHLIDIKTPDQDFSAGEFRLKAGRIIKRLFSKGKQPIVVGGTGLYIKTLTDGIFDSPPCDKKLREDLYEKAFKYGNEYVWNELKEVDPVIIEKIHANNLTRIVRALEVYYQTGIPFSQWHKKTDSAGFAFKIFGLLWQREILYERINQRVEEMFKKGLVEETKKLVESYGTSRSVLNGLGYRQIIGVLEGKYDLEKALELTKRDSRRYAKRQMTWWRKDSRVKWIKMESITDLKNVTQEILLNFP